MSESQTFRAIPPDMLGKPKGPASLSAAGTVPAKQLPAPVARLRDIFRPVSTTPLPASTFTAAGVTMSPTSPTSATFNNWDFRTSTRWDNENSLYWMSGKPVALSTANLDAGCITRTTGALNNQTSVVSHTFVGKHLVWVFQAYGPSSVALYIDNHRVLYEVTGSNIYYLSIPFAEYSAHDIVLDFGLCVPIIAMHLATDRLIRGGPRFTIGLDGDSYADLGQSPDVGGLKQALFEETGCAVVGLAQGSTGWGAQLDPQVLTKAPYEDSTRIQARKTADPDLILCIGSINSGDKTVAQILASARAYLSGIPEIPVVLTGPERLNNGGAGLKAQNDALRDLRYEFSNVVGFVEWYDQQWQQGAGSVTGPDGLGNQDWIIGPDLVHANLVGNRYFAKLFAGALGALPYGPHQ